MCGRAVSPASFFTNPVDELVFSPLPLHVAERQDLRHAARSTLLGDADRLWKAYTRSREG